MAQRQKLVEPNVALNGALLKASVETLDQLSTALPAISESLNDIACDLHVLALYARKKGEGESVFSPEELQELDRTMDLDDEQRGAEQAERN